MIRETVTLTTGEAAELCGVSRSTLRRAVAQGHLQAWHTPGRHLRFSEAACLSFAQSLGRMDIELIGRRYTLDEAAPGRADGAIEGTPVPGVAHAVRS